MQRFLSFAMVIGIGFLLMTSLVLGDARRPADHATPDVAGLAHVWYAANAAISFVVITVLFATIFQVLPDVTVRWRRVARGGAHVAAVRAWAATRSGQYVGRTTLWSSYGRGGKSLIVLLVWIYYSAQILFPCAEFTKVTTRRAARRGADRGGRAHDRGGPLRRPASRTRRSSRP